MRRLVYVAVLVIATPAMATTGDVLVVATDDAELSQALVHAASQQFNGPVAPAPGDWSGPVRAGTLRLHVVAGQPGSWHLELVGPVVSVARDLHVSSEIRLDVAEAIALALPGLQARLDTRSKEIEEAERERIRERNRLAAEARQPPAPAPPPVAPPPAAQLPVATLVAPAAVAVPAPSKRPLPPPEEEANEPAEPPHHTAPPPSDLPPPPPPMLVSVRPLHTGSVVGVALTPGLLAGSHVTAAGSDVSLQLAFQGPWLGRLSMGVYGSHFQGGALWLIPIDVLFGARLTQGPVHLDVAFGGELGVASAASESGLVTGFVGQVTGSVHVNPAWSVGLRFSTAFTTDSGESSPQTDRNLYIPQAQFRIGLLASWESEE